MPDPASQGVKGIACATFTSHTSGTLSHKDRHFWLLPGLGLGVLRMLQHIVLLLPLLHQVRLADRPCTTSAGPASIESLPQT